MRVDVNAILIIVAFVFGWPLGTILAAAMTMRRGRWLSLLGAAIGAALTALAVYGYATTIQVDALSYALGAFLATTTGAITGALVVSFLLSLMDRRSGRITRGA
jgi:hypothetical protein